MTLGKRYEIRPARSSPIAPLVIFGYKSIIDFSSSGSLNSIWKRFFFYVLFGLTRMNDDWDDSRFLVEREFTVQVTTFHRGDARIGGLSWNHQALLVHDDATAAQAFLHIFVDVVVVEIVVNSSVVWSVVLIVVRFGNHSAAFFICTQRERETDAHTQEWSKTENNGYLGQIRARQRSKKIKLNEPTKSTYKLRHRGMNYKRKLQWIPSFRHSKKATICQMELRRLSFSCLRGCCCWFHMSERCYSWLRNEPNDRSWQLF